MGSEEFARPVRGSGGRAISTTQSSAFEVDNYAEGASFSVDTAAGDSYPLTVDPAETIQYLTILETGTDINIEMTTKTGTVIGPVPLRGVALEEGATEIDSFKLTDPDGTGADTYGYWRGE